MVRTFKSSSVIAVAGSHNGGVHLPPLSGTVDTRFAEVREVFAGLLSTGEETGAGLAVSIGGRLVVDLVGGWRDVPRTDPWAQDTLGGSPEPRLPNTL